MTPASTEHQVISALLQSGLLTPESLERVQTAARQSGVSVSSVVTRLGLVTEQEMASAFSDLLGIEIVRRQGFPSQIPQIAGLNPQYLKSKKALPLSVDEAIDERGQALRFPHESRSHSAIDCGARLTSQPMPAWPSAFEFS